MPWTFTYTTYACRIMKCSVSYVQFLIQSFGISDVFYDFKTIFFICLKNIHFKPVATRKKQKYQNGMMHAIADHNNGEKTY